MTEKNGFAIYANSMQTGFAQPVLTNAGFGLGNLNFFSICMVACLNPATGQIKQASRQYVAALNDLFNILRLLAKLLYIQFQVNHGLGNFQRAGLGAQGVHFTVHFLE